MVPPREWLRRTLPPRCTRRERNLALARRAVIERPFYVRMWPISAQVHRIFGLEGPESYRELRLEPLCCPRLSRGTAPREREYPRRKDRF
jgi:hypothetical protein